MSANANKDLGTTQLSPQEGVNTCRIKFANSLDEMRSYDHQQRGDLHIS